MDNAIPQDEIIKILEDSDIEYELMSLGEEILKRIIKFKIYDNIYHIVWYKNYSTLFIGEYSAKNNFRACCIPFRYIFVDRTYPLQIQNLSIGFAYDKNKKEYFYDSEYSFGSFRIPLEIKENNVS